MLGEWCRLHEQSDAIERQTAPGDTGTTAVFA
jgi:hypothetical protein